MMGDIQQYFIDRKVCNFYSVSISGNPISQLAFTLVNGFTFVEYFLSRGMHISEALYQVGGQYRRNM